MTNTNLRWVIARKLRGTTPAIDAFLQEVTEVCARHGMSISHEDGQGAFVIEPYSEENIAWLRDADDGVSK